tara:strand:- start:6 stop:695 length:690 start_codon:yes stop_codon:yes gene_type:complete
MVKEDKKIIKYINKNNLEKNTAYRDPVSGRFYITDSKGKFKNFTTEEEAIAYKDQKNLDKKFKQVVEDEKVAAYKKERKTKKKLQEVKKDPTLAKEALDKAYKNYEELVTKIEDAEDDGEDAKVRVLNRKKANATENLYKTSRATQTLTGGNEISDAYSYVTGQTPEQFVDTKAATSLSKEKAMRESGAQNTSVRPRTIEQVKPTIASPVDLKKLSDEELIKTLKLNQK